MPPPAVRETKFLLPPPVTPGMVTALLDELERDFGPDRHFHGFLVLRGGDSSGGRIYARADLEPEMAKDWSRIEDIAVYLSDDARRSELTVKPRLGTAVIGRSDGPLTAIPVPGALRYEGDPWRYRRTAALYKVRDFDPATFADELLALARAVAFTDDPEIRDAFWTRVDRDKVEILSGFERLEPFLASLRALDPRDLARIELAFRGPSGRAIGLALNYPERTLSVRSSLEEKALFAAMTGLGGALRLTEPQAATNEGSSIGGAKPAFQETFWTKYLLGPLLGAGIGLIGLESLRALTSGYQLVLTAPITAGGKMVIPPGPIDIAWYLKPDDGLFKGRRSDGLADISVIRVGAIVPDLSRAAQSSPTRLELPAGVYQIVVEPRAEADAQSFTVTVIQPR